MLNDYITERIIPGSPNTKKDKYVVKSRKMFEELYQTLKIENFSGIKKKNQFILTASGMETGKYDVRYCSSGEKLIWYTLVLINYIQNMGILIIDEPENHLHESLLWKFILLLKEIASDETNEITLSQVFLLTHSKNLIYNNFSDGLNFVIENKDLKLLEYEHCESILRDIGVSCINEKILFVEGSTDQSLLQGVLAEDNIHINVLGNCNAIIKAYEGIQEVSKYVQDKRFVFMMDKDTRDDEEIERLRNENPNYFDSHVLILDCHEIENYLLNEKSICRAYNEIADVLGKETLAERDCKEDMKNIADESFELTKRKYLNYLLHTKLSRIDSLINKNEIVLESENDFEQYIDNTFSSQKWTDILSQMHLSYNKMNKKYSKESWSKQWKKLCDGKNVFNQLVAKMAGKLGIKKDDLQRKIIKTELGNKESELSILVNEITRLYN